MIDLELVKVILNAGTMGVLLIVLLGGYRLFMVLGTKLDKLTEAIIVVGAKVETVGKVQDARLDLLEERMRMIHGMSNSTGPKSSHPSWSGSGQ